MSNGWTPERRARQAELIRSWKPWERSTGPRTAEGKGLVARNAWKGGYRAMFGELGQALTMQRKSLEREASEVKRA
jgi:hypothetical protein